MMSHMAQSSAVGSGDTYMYTTKAGLQMSQITTRYAMSAKTGKSKLTKSGRIQINKFQIVESGGFKLLKKKLM